MKQNIILAVKGPKAGGLVTASLLPILQSQGYEIEFAAVVSDGENPHVLIGAADQLNHVPAPALAPPPAVQIEILERLEKKTDILLARTEQPVPLKPEVRQPSRPRGKKNEGGAEETDKPLLPSSAHSGQHTGGTEGQQEAEDGEGAKEEEKADGQAAPQEGAGSEEPKQEDAQQA